MLPALLETFIEQPALLTAALFIMHIWASDASVNVSFSFDKIIAHIDVVVISVVVHILVFSVDVMIVFRRMRYSMVTEM